MSEDNKEKPQPMMSDAKLEAIFTYHAPFGNQAARYEDLRATAKGFARVIQQHCPESREKALAFTSLQQAVMWGNAAIAINEKG